MKITRDNTTYEGSPDELRAAGLLPAPLSDEMKASLERGIADALAGRVVPLDSNLLSPFVIPTVITSEPTHSPDCAIVKAASGYWSIIPPTCDCGAELPRFYPPTIITTGTSLTIGDPCERCGQAGARGFTHNCATYSVTRIGPDGQTYESTPMPASPTVLAYAVEHINRPIH